MVGPFDQLDHGAGAQVGAADADDHQSLGVAADFLRGGLDAGKFLLVVVDRQIDPADEVITGTGTVDQGLDGSLAGGLVDGGAEVSGAGAIQLQHTVMILLKCCWLRVAFHGVASQHGGADDTGVVAHDGGDDLGEVPVEALLGHVFPERGEEELSGMA